jgi:hypothetical protein
MDILFLRFKLQEGARFPAAVFIVGIGIRHVSKMKAWNYTILGFTGQPLTPLNRSAKNN